MKKIGGWQRVTICPICGSINSINYRDAVCSHCGERWSKLSLADMYIVARWVDIRKWWERPFKKEKGYWELRKEKKIASNHNEKQTRTSSRR